MNGGTLSDGTPFVIIGSGEPEAKEWIVQTECEQCGEQHHFDFWAMFRGEEITCEHCGHKTRATRKRLVGDEWAEEGGAQ